MDTNLDEVRKEIDILSKEISKKEKLARSIEEQISESIRERNKKLSDVKDIEADKEKTLELAAQKQARSQDVFLLNEKLIKVRNEAEDLGRIHDEALRLKEKAAIELKAMDGKMAGLKHKIWHKASEIEREEVKNNLPVLRSWACLLLASVPISLGQFLSTHFTKYDLPELKAIKADLQKKYNMEVNSDE
jgi:hypothetical protein